MHRNVRIDNRLGGYGSLRRRAVRPRARIRGRDAEVMADDDAVPPFALAPLAFDTSLGWSGWGPGAAFIPAARGMAAGGGWDGSETETREGR